MPLPDIRCPYSDAPTPNIKTYIHAYTLGRRSTRMRWLSVPPDTTSHPPLTSVSLSTCVHACMHTYMDTYMHACMHACMALNRACSGTPASGPCTYIHILMYVCVYVYAYAYMHAYTYTHRDIPVFHVSHTYTAGIDVHICAYICVCMCFYL